jgi:hypothetical protein
MPVLTRSTRAGAALCAVIVATFGLTACSSSTKHSASAPPSGESGKPVDTGARTDVTSADGALTLETTSTRAADVAGGQVLVTVSGHAVTTNGSTNSEALHVTSNGTDFSRVFGPAGSSRRGLITGLVNGNNTIVASSASSRVQLTVVNHSAAGPVFSGPHLEPWACTTQQNGLGPATDKNCDAPTRTTWSYKATDGSLKPLSPPTTRPADLTTIVVNGKRVPFIIRTEEGTIDRGIYWIWVLDPDAGTPGAWHPAAWNDRLVYRFGGGCGTGYSQGSALAVSVDPDLLAHGYALATNSLDTFQTACNDVLSAEAEMMTRQHFIESYGVPRFTIGDGGSGGAIQQMLVAYNYPGLLDAVSAALPFPDALSIAGGVTDCGLLANYYSTTHGNALTTAQQEAINGHESTGTCREWDNLFVGGVRPQDGCDPQIPKSEIYDPATNRSGVRCTLADINVNMLGRDPATGFANRPLDNTGIQYGLKALNDHVINVDQFLDLNQYIGGYDIDGNITAARETMSESVAANAYRTGRVTEAGPLLDVPIILRNIYTDALGDIHTRTHAFAIRDRLAVNGHDDPNLLLWTVPGASGDLVNDLLGNAGGANTPIIVLDQWLTKTAQTNSTAPIAQRLTTAKPPDAVNQCILPSGQTLTGGWELYDQPGPCATAYPIHDDPRIVAGSAQRQDIVKCQVKAIDMHDYAVPFTAAQQSRLSTIFAKGVCDWSKPGVGQQPLTGVWLSYGP